MVDNLEPEDDPRQRLWDTGFSWSRQSVPTNMRRGTSRQSSYNSDSALPPFNHPWLRATGRALNGRSTSSRTRVPGRARFDTARADERNQRYFQSFYDSLLGEDGNDQANLEAVLGSDLPGSGMRREDVNAAEEIIMQIMFGGGGVRGVLDRAVQLSLEDNELFTQLQYQLMQHGFMTEGMPNFGEMDPQTSNALVALIQDKTKVGADVSMSEYLATRRKGWFDQTFADMSDDMAEVDKAKAERLKSLKDQIENVDLSVALTSSEALTKNIQDRAKDEIGRALSDSEVQSIISNVHEQERRDFWANSSVVKEYQQLRREWEDIVTNNDDRVGDVLGGVATSDLDQFLAAIKAVESGGNPNAYNPDSTTFGSYQFLPSTWRDAARKAGLDPNDRSAENQDAVARFLAASYFKASAKTVGGSGSWREVAKMWYAGENHPSVGNDSLGNRSQRRGRTNYSTINQYADRIVNIMAAEPLDPRIDPAMAAADAGSLGVVSAGAGDLDPVQLHNWWQGDKMALNLGADRPGLSDLPSSQVGGEYESWDIDSYLRSAVREAGGVDTDAFSFAKSALDFYDLIGPR